MLVAESNMYLSSFLNSHLMYGYFHIFGYTEVYFLDLFFTCPIDSFDLAVVFTVKKGGHVVPFMVNFELEWRDSIVVGYICIGVDKEDKWCHTTQKKNRCDQLVEAIKLLACESVSVDIVHFVTIISVGVNSQIKVRFLF